MIKINQLELNSWMEKSFKSLLKGNPARYTLYLREFNGVASLSASTYRQKGIELLYVSTDEDVCEYLGEISDDMSRQELFMKFGDFIMNELNECFSFYPRNLWIPEEKEQLYNAVKKSINIVKDRFSEIPIVLEALNTMEWVIQ